MSGHPVPDEVQWGKCIFCRCIKAWYTEITAGQMCFTCHMEAAAADMARFEAGEQETYRYWFVVCDGECETEGCEEPFLFDEDKDGTAARCFECWARDLVDAKMRPEEEDEEEDEKEDEDEAD
jgi:hypothetical protein